MALRRNWFPRVMLRNYTASPAFPVRLATSSKGRIEEQLIRAPYRAQPTIGPTVTISIASRHCLLVSFIFEGWPASLVRGSTLYSKYLAYLGSEGSSRTASVRCTIYYVILLCLISQGYESGMVWYDSVSSLRAEGRKAQSNSNCQGPFTELETEAFPRR